MNDAESIIDEADALVRQNRITEAKQLYQKVTQLDPDNPDAWFMLGLVEQQQSNPVLAEVHLRRAIGLDDRFPEAHLNLASLLQQQGRVDEAKHHARQAAQISDDYVDAWVLLGGLELDSKQYGPAEECFKQALRFWPDTGDLYANLGHCQAATDQLAEAETSFDCAISLGAASADNLLALARVNLRLMHYQAAVKNANAAYAKNPGRPEIQHFLANSLIADGRAAEALPILNRLVGTQKSSAELCFSLGNAYYALKDSMQACTWFERASEAQPASALYLTCLASAEFHRGHFDTVIEHCRQALKLQPDHDESALLLADALRMTGGFPEAVAIYQDLLRRSTGNDLALAGLLELYEKTGNLEESRRLLDQTPEKILSESPEIGLVAAKTYAHIGKRPVAIRLLTTLLASVEMEKYNPDDLVRISIHNQLGKLLDREERYQEAFSHFKAANNLRHSDFVVTEHVQEIDRIIADWQAAAITTAPVSTNQSSRPIFIVGMPRCGSTLVEQILSSHPLVMAGGELPILPHIAEQMSGEIGRLPFASPRYGTLNEQQLDNAAQAYLVHLPGTESGTRYITDKNLYNYLHLGLISVLFPKARIIHCKRSPLDTCLSIYEQNFSGPKGFANSLEAIGIVYAQYLRLMEHWQSRITNPVFELSYEALVNDQAQTTRSLLAFCGLPWDERCLSFQDNDRTALTASYNQVRQPMYRHSIGRWRNYEAHLPSLVALLGEK